MNFLVKMLSGEGDTNPSSKRVITLLAFLLMVVGFFAELIYGIRVSPQTFDAISYIVLGGLGFTASEKFTSKK
jgi:hypothetical protein